MNETLRQNPKGAWVPAIPLPLYGLIRKRCACGRAFWTRDGYESHYALHHILMQVEPPRSQQSWNGRAATPARTQ